jgi:hypothetical protein
MFAAAPKRRDVNVRWQIRQESDASAGHRFSKSADTHCRAVRLASAIDARKICCCGSFRIINRHNVFFVNDVGLQLGWDHGAAQRVNFRAPPDVY